MNRTEKISVIRAKIGQSVNETSVDLQKEQGTFSIPYTTHFVSLKET